KLRESKFVSLEGIQWTDMLQGLQPARKPIPGGMSWIQPPKLPSSEKPLQSLSEPINFSGKNPSIEASPISESADAQQEN
ncbi:MAG: GNAT family N-acetyltransferase, partial [Nostoc sp.]